MLTSSVMMIRSSTSSYGKSTACPIFTDSLLTVSKGRLWGPAHIGTLLLGPCGKYQYRKLDGNNGKTDVITENLGLVWMLTLKGNTVSYIFSK